MEAVGLILTERGRAKLRVGVPPAVTRYSPATGVGRMWYGVLAGLRGSDVEVIVAEPDRRRRTRHVDVWLGDGLQAALAVREPTVIQLHEAPWDDPTQVVFFDRAFVEHCRRTSAETAAQASQIVTPSVASKRQIVATYGVAASTVHVAPHGVDTAVFRPEVADQGRCLVAGRGGSAPYVLIVATVHPRKNIAALRTAMVGLAGRGHRHLLVMVVSPPADRADGALLMSDATAELPGFPGRVVVLRGLAEAEMAAVMAGADVLCAPSFSEGFGLTPLEAMASGTPVVVSDRGSLPEVVGDAGVVTTTDADDIEQALDRVISDTELRRRLVEGGRLRSRELTWRRTAAGWLDALTAAAEGR